MSVCQYGQHLAGVLGRFGAAIVHKDDRHRSSCLPIAKDMVVIANGNDLRQLAASSHKVNDLSQGLDWQPSTDGQIVDKEVGSGIHAECLPCHEVSLDLDGCLSGIKAFGKCLGVHTCFLRIAFEEVIRILRLPPLVGGGKQKLVHLPVAA
jgi:hypothetical protein